MIIREELKRQIVNLRNDMAYGTQSNTVTEQHLRSFYAS